MNWHFFAMYNRAFVIDGFAQYIHNPSQCSFAYWHFNGNGVFHNDLWQIGRILRTAGGLALIATAFFPGMSGLVEALGLFYMLEGAANLAYWRFFGNGVKDNNYWQLGRLVRTGGGLVLIAIGAAA